MAVLPIVPTVIMPTLLNGAINGQLDDAALEEVQPGIWLQRDAARSFREMREHAHADHIELRIEYGYRDYATQKSIFLNRYVQDYIAGAESVMWNGRRYWKLPGVASAAVPGTSNHGWGLAVDIDRSKPGAVDWLIANAVRHGWSGELQSEPWHWRRFAGNYYTPPPEDDMTKQEFAEAIGAQIDPQTGLVSVELLERIDPDGTPVVKLYPFAAAVAYTHREMKLARLGR